MPQPNEIVSALVARLTDHLREIYEERAAIMEFDGGLPREYAEALALLALIQQYPSEVFACWQ